MADVKRVVSTNGAELTNKMTIMLISLRDIKLVQLKEYTVIEEDSGFTAIVETKKIY